MKLRPRDESVPRSTPLAFGAACFPPGAMQPGQSVRPGGGPGKSEGAPVCPSAQPPKGSEDTACQRGGDVCIQLSPPPAAETGGNAGPRQPPPRPGAHGRSHTHGEARGGPDGALDVEDHGGSALSELRYLFQWLHKSLPYLLILSLKLLAEHVTGISLGIGLLTTFMYANKSIVNQVFLRERRSKLQCAWLLLFLTGSSLLLYYAFRSQSLHYSLILLSPAVDLMNFWEALWVVGVTDFVLKFAIMGLKCVVLLLPPLVVPFKSKGYWYMFLEEVGQQYRAVVPVPVWFRYFVGSRELDGPLGWGFGVLLALLYLVLKVTRARSSPEVAVLKVAEGSTLV